MSLRPRQPNPTVSVNAIHLDGQWAGIILLTLFLCSVHTTRYLRRTSTVLFTSILAASARFYRKDLHPVLLSHAQTILDRAVTAGATDIGMVQSLMILTYWKVSQSLPDHCLYPTRADPLRSSQIPKEASQGKPRQAKARALTTAIQSPADTSAWRKSGIAIRTGYQLYWHIQRREALPPDETSARLILVSPTFNRDQTGTDGILLHAERGKGLVLRVSLDQA